MTTRANGSVLVQFELLPLNSKGKEKIGYNDDKVTHQQITLDEMSDRSIDFDTVAEVRNWADKVTMNRLHTSQPLVFMSTNKGPVRTKVLRTRKKTVSSNTRVWLWGSRVAGTWCWPKKMLLCGLLEQMARNTNTSDVAKDFLDVNKKRKKKRRFPLVFIDKMFSLSLQDRGGEK